MTVEAYRIDLISHQSINSADMRIMANVAFTFFKHEMYMLTGEFFLKFFMTFVAEFRNPRFKLDLGKCSTRPNHKQSEAQGHGNAYFPLWPLHTGMNV